MIDEVNRVKNAEKLSVSEPLVVKNLVKKYKKKGKNFNAVDNLSFGIESSECFGYNRYVFFLALGRKTRLTWLTGISVCFIF